MLQKAAGTLLFFTFVLQLLAVNMHMPQLAMSMSIDYKLQTTQELGANPNVMSRQDSNNELKMGSLHLALQFRQQECVSELLKHELVRNLGSEIQ